ncbi:MAG: T9SS type A sorting domain-containing protein, partial [Candidatus Kapaibacterium sp.]
SVLSFVLPQSAEVSISILDALGRELQIVPAQEMDAGAHEMSLDASDWAAGVYECRIVVEGESAVSKLVVIH